MYSDSSTPVIQAIKELPSLVENLLLLLSEKEKTVIIRRFDLDNKGKATLEEIGQQFGVTRERVRQIEKNALNKMKRNVFNTGLKGIHNIVSEIVSTNGGLMKTDMLMSELKSMYAGSDEFKNCNLNLAFVLHEEVESVGNTINFHPYVRHKAIRDNALKTAANSLVNQLQKNQEVKNLSRLHKDLKSKMDELDFNITKMKSLVEIDKRITILNDNTIGLIEWRHIHPRTLRDKIAYILRNEKKPIHFIEISEKISSANFDQRKVNVQAVHNELIRHDNFVLIGRGIYALKDWGYEKGTVADVIEKLLKKHGEMHQDEIIEAVMEKRQVKKITIILSLKNNEKFTRTGRQVYKLKA